MQAFPSGVGGGWGCKLPPTVFCGGGKGREHCELPSAVPWNGQENVASFTPALPWEAVSYLLAVSLGSRRL